MPQQNTEATPEQKPQPQESQTPPAKCQALEIGHRACECPDCNFNAAVK